jgi:predicted AAA+ superfamily ATPase
MVHRFHLDDYYLVVDPCSASVHAVDEMAYELIGLYEGKSREEAIAELSARFGEKIYFGRPDKKEFNRIVLEIAKRRGLDFDDETLLKEANKWELSHGGKSGRTAEQFMDYIEGVKRPGSV